MGIVYGYSFCGDCKNYVGVIRELYEACMRLVKVEKKMDTTI